MFGIRLTYLILDFPLVVFTAFNNIKYPAQTQFFIFLSIFNRNI